MVMEVRKTCAMTRTKKIDVEEEGCACYVLITCDKPNAEGEMKVEMTYDGDEALASYLLASAQQVFENDG